MLKYILTEPKLNSDIKKKLLEETAKVALESNQTEIAWKIALLSEREK